MVNEDMDPSVESQIDRMRRFLGRAGVTGMTSMAWLSPEGRVPIRQTELAPDGLEFCEDVSPGRWVEEGLSGFARVNSLLPRGFPLTPGCFIRPTWTTPKSSRSGGPRSPHGQGARCIP